MAACGLPVDPGLWYARVAALVREWTSPEAGERGRDRMETLVEYAAAVLEQARQTGRARARWYMQRPGRWATRDPLLHSITRHGGLRDAIITAPERRLVQADLSSAHVWIAAALTKQRQLWLDLEQGSFYEAAAAILVPDASTPEGARSAAKIAVLAFLNGAEDDTLRAHILEKSGVALDPEEMAARLQRWLASYPGFAEGLQRLRGRRTITSPRGRVFEAPRSVPDHSVVSWWLQAFESDAIVLAIEALDQAGYEPVFWLYDSIFVEVELERAEATAVVVANTMDAVLRGVIGGRPKPGSRTVKTSVARTWSGADVEPLPDPGGPVPGLPAGPVYVSPEVRLRMALVLKLEVSGRWARGALCPRCKTKRASYSIGGGLASCRCGWKGEVGRLLEVSP